MTKREKKLLIAAIIIIISLFGTKEVIIPTINKVSSINAKLEESEYQLERTTLQLNSFEKYQEKLTEINRKNSLYESFFYKGDPAEVRIEILEFLDGLIKELDLIVESKEFSIESGNTEFSNKDIENDLFKFLYRAQIRGTYVQLLSFLESISNYDKYFNINQLDIKRSSDNSYLTVSLLIESYCIKAVKDNPDENNIIEDTGNGEQIVINKDYEEDIRKVSYKKGDQSVN